MSHYWMQQKSILPEQYGWPICRGKSATGVCQNRLLTFGILVLCGTGFAISGVCAMFNQVVLYQDIVWCRLAPKLLDSAILVFCICMPSLEAVSRQKKEFHMQGKDGKVWVPSNMRIHRGHCAWFFQKVSVRASSYFYFERSCTPFRSASLILCVLLTLGLNFGMKLFCFHGY